METITNFYWGLYFGAVIIISSVLFYILIKGSKKSKDSANFEFKEQHLFPSVLTIMMMLPSLICAIVLNNFDFDDKTGVYFNFLAIIGGIYWLYRSSTAKLSLNSKSN